MSGSRRTKNPIEKARQLLLENSLNGTIIYVEQMLSEARNEKDQLYYQKVMKELLK